MAENNEEKKTEKGNFLQFSKDKIFQLMFFVVVKISEKTTTKKQKSKKAKKYRTPMVSLKSF
jgi:hypothetical protein